MLTDLNYSTSFFVFLPITFHHTMYVMSEALYTLLVSLVFILTKKAGEGTHLYNLVAIFIGLTVITRTIGFVLIPAFAPYLAANREKHVIKLCVLSILHNFIVDNISISICNKS